MTTPRVHTIKREGSRFYVNPEDGTKKVPGVTSVLGMLPKPFLKFWAAKMTAEAAVNELGTIVTMTLNDPSAAVDHLKKASDRFTRKAADEGTAAHDIFERMAKGETIGRVHPDLELYVSHYRDFLATVKPEFHSMECTVWSDTYGYAGSYDAIAVIDGEVVILDNKTTRSGIHSETGLQLAAYRYADYIIDENGERMDLPEITGGAVLHIRPETGWKLVPVACGEAQFEMFKHLLAVFEYDKVGSKQIVGAPAYSGPSEETKATTNQRRAPRAQRKDA